MKFVAKLSFMYTHITSVTYAAKVNMDTAVIRTVQKNYRAVNFPYF